MLPIHLTPHIPLWLPHRILCINLLLRSFAPLKIFHLVVNQGSTHMVTLIQLAQSLELTLSQRLPPRMVTLIQPLRSMELALSQAFQTRTVTLTQPARSMEQALRQGVPTRMVTLVQQGRSMEQAVSQGVPTRMVIFIQRARNTVLVWQLSPSPII